jgi:hypothetical protein
MYVFDRWISQRHPEALEKYKTRVKADQALVLWDWLHWRYMDGATILAAWRLAAPRCRNMAKSE